MSPVGRRVCLASASFRPKKRKNNEVTQAPPKPALASVFTRV